MARLAASSGTTDLVATPHANPEYPFRPELIAQRAAELEAATGGKPRLHTGCDFHLSFDNVQDAIENPTKYTINHGCYLLVEFSDLAIFHTTTDIFRRLMDAGMIPVITHPERNALLQQRLADIRSWVDSGCLLQVTAQSLTGRFGSRAKEFAGTLVSEGLVHVIASDGHDLKRRPPSLQSGREALAAGWGEEVAAALTVANPKAIVESRPLPAAPAVRPRRKWFPFWS